ncbi:unnamed protein product [Trichogramma brassicae]|uniref:Uncharacterized protein n=1 Tax=Trichogramma brassicae TaxID=86971 RepID=A0A6H5HUS1_9HYME|nr:unnamed protein product [Trichogramma brassicae]
MRIEHTSAHAHEPGLGLRMRIELTSAHAHGTIVGLRMRIGQIPVVAAPLGADQFGATAALEFLHLLHNADQRWQVAAGHGVRTAPESQQRYEDRSLPQSIVGNTRNRQYYLIIINIIRKSAALCCKRFPGSHTFDAVADMLESLHLQFNLTTDKVVGTVTDNGSNFVKAFREFAIDDFEPVLAGIDKLQAENNIYYGYFLPTLLTIRQRWQELLQQGNDVELSTTVLEQMIDKLESRFADFFTIKNQGEIAALAALTHPKFKCEWLSCMGKAEHEKVKELIRKAIPAEQVNTVKKTVPRDKNTFFQFDADAARKILQTEFIPQPKDETELMQFLHEESADLELLHKYPKQSREWQHIEGLQLADPNFTRPGRIDLLLSAQIHARIIQAGLRKGETLMPWRLRPINHYMTYIPTPKAKLKEWRDNLRKRDALIRHKRCSDTTVIDIFEDGFQISDEEYAKWLGQ